MVAVHDIRLPSAEGKAETPGAGEVMSCISSVCNLDDKSASCSGTAVSVISEGRTSW